MNQVTSEMVKEIKGQITTELNDSDMIAKIVKLIQQRQKYKQKQNEWVENNRDMVNARQKRYYQRHREEILARQKAQKEKNKAQKLANNVGNGSSPSSS